jgi:hypothetical protein
MNSCFMDSVSGSILENINLVVQAHQAVSDHIRRSSRHGERLCVFRHHLLDKTDCVFHKGGTRGELAAVPWTTKA